eukprot:766411-Hanusia_phi.AAC.8
MSESEISSEREFETRCLLPRTPRNITRRLRELVEAAVHSVLEDHLLAARRFVEDRFLRITQVEGERGGVGDEEFGEEDGKRRRGVRRGRRGWEGGWERTRKFNESVATELAKLPSFHARAAEEILSSKLNDFHLVLQPCEGAV